MRLSRVQGDGVSQEPLGLCTVGGKNQQYCLPLAVKSLVL